MAELLVKNIKSIEGTSSKSKAIVRLVIGSMFLTCIPFFVEFSGVDALTNGFYRMVVGGTILLSIACFRKENLPSLRTFWLSFFAALAIAIDSVLWNQSVLYVGSGLATVLSGLEVVFMMFMGAIFLN